MFRLEYINCCVSVLYITIFAESLYQSCCSCNILLGLMLYFTKQIYGLKHHQTDLLKGEILGSRIPDIFSRKSGHIKSKIMKINVTNTPIFKGIVHDRAFRYIIVHYLCFELSLLTEFIVRTFWT